MLHLPDINRKLLDFVESNAGADTKALRLSSKPTEDFDKSFAITQIEARKKASSKLSSYLARRNFIFPDSLSAEQATHQKVARFHASLITPGAKVLDMTCGLGIDAFEIASVASVVTAADLDPLRAEAAIHNAHTLSLDNIKVVAGDSVELLQEGDSWDCIMVDPARRDTQKNRTYALKDCLPDVTAISGLLTEKASQVLIKASPMLDISEAVRELPHCSRVFVVSYKGECKEVLIELKSKHSGNPEIIAVLINDNDETSFAVSFSELGSGASQRPDVAALLCSGRWLYEPDAALMKMGAWRALENRFPALSKLAHHTHLFVSDSLYADFPGRIIEISGVFTPNSKEAKALKGEKWNVATRNAPLTPEQLKKKLGLRDGGPNFLYYLSAEGSRPLIVTGEPKR